MTDFDDDEYDDMTSLHDADFPRVDLVSRPANGSPGFLVMKQDAEAAGLLPPELIRDLIAKAEPDSPGRERVTMPSGVTLSGSPADIAAFIHKASVRETDDVAKADESTKSQNDLPDSDFAYIEDGGKKDESGKTTPRSKRHFPIHDAAHVRNALARLSSSPFGDKASGKVHAAARKFGIDVAKKESAMAGTVTKADNGPELDDGVDGMDPMIPLAAPEDDDAPGDPTDPGSPAWEAIDAATASKWTSILARAKVALGVMADREMLEAAAADPDDAENAFDLQDAACAIDYAISVLAPFAVSEQSEADCGAAEMEMIGKAMAGFDPVPLGQIEALTAIAKAGRVLSSANEAAIRNAADSLQHVLASLPSAPLADDHVTKEEAAMPAAQTEAEPADPEAEVAKADEAAAPAEPEPAEVAKADKEPQVVVYNAKGEVVGIVDPAKIVPVQGAAPAGEAKPAEAAPAADPAPAPAPAADAPALEATPAAAPAAAEAAPDPADMTPAPAADAGTPADEVAKDGQQETTTDITDEREVLKSIVAEAVAAAFGAQAPAEDIAKQADVAGALAEVEVLKARLLTLEEQPAMPKVFTNGAVPPAHMLRGQDRARQGAPPAVDVAKAAELKGTLYHGTAQEQNEAHKAMQELAIAQLSAIHGG
jgi:hypothetical protein